MHQMCDSRASNRPPPDPTSTALPALCTSHSRHHTALSRSQAQHRLPGHPHGSAASPPCCTGLPSPFWPPQTNTLPLYSTAFLSSHNTGREQLLGLEGFTGIKILFSKFSHHTTSVPFLGSGIHLQGAVVLLCAQTPGAANRYRDESDFDGF